MAKKVKGKGKTALEKWTFRAYSARYFLCRKTGNKLLCLFLYSRWKRTPGLVKGKVTEAFFEPLPDEELAYWHPT